MLETGSIHQYTVSKGDSINRPELPYIRSAFLCGYRADVDIADDRRPQPPAGRVKVYTCLFTITLWGILYSALFGRQVLSCTTSNRTFHRPARYAPIGPISPALLGGAMLTRKQKWRRVRRSTQKKVRVLAMVNVEVHASTPPSSLTCSGKNVRPKRVTIDPRVQIYVPFENRN